MAEVTRTREEGREGRRRDEGDGRGHDMRPLAVEVERVHSRPVPESVWPDPKPFPAVFWYGLLASVVIGAVVGLVFARLLFTGVIAPRGWEGIFSLVPFTFYFFWMMMGLALGLAVGGVVTVLVMPEERREVEGDDGEQG